MYWACRSWVYGLEQIPASFWASVSSSSNGINNRAPCCWLVGVLNLCLVLSEAEISGANLPCGLRCPVSSLRTIVLFAPKDVFLDEKMLLLCPCLFPGKHWWQIKQSEVVFKVSILASGPEAAPSLILSIWQVKRRMWNMGFCQLPSQDSFLSVKQGYDAAPPGHSLWSWSGMRAASVSPQGAGERMRVGDLTLV